MDRRRFLKSAGTTLAGLGATHMLSGRHAHARNKDGANRRRPNILYIMTDQQFAGAMSCAGNTDLKTPAMDSLARTGARFENAYCAQPLCVPSRTVMMTGRMPHETGVTINMPEHEIRVPMLGRVFSDAGYDCGYAGKWHLPVPTTQKRVHGFATVTCPVGANPRRKKDPDVAPACAKFLATQRTKPFFLVASFLNPHDICQWARGQTLPNGPIGDAPAPDRCPKLPDNFEIPAHEPDALRAIQTQAPRIYPTLEWQPDRWRQYRWAYYRLVEMVDAEIGRLLDTLRRSGDLDHTLIVFASDHGDGAGAHRWNQKQVLYEQPARVPFIVSYKGVTRPGHVDRTHLVSSGMDLIPTLCDYAGIAAPPGLDGLSVRPLAEGRTPKTWRDFVVSETTFCNSGEGLELSGRMLRTERYKYIVYSTGTVREQLFDMERDPGETVNLAVKPQHKAILADHRRRLAAWCRQTNDPFTVPTRS